MPRVWRVSSRIFSLKRALGLITGASDNDQSAIGTYAAAGARLDRHSYERRPLRSPDVCGRLSLLKTRTGYRSRTLCRHSAELFQVVALFLLNHWLCVLPFFDFTHRLSTSWALSLLVPMNFVVKFCAIRVLLANPSATAQYGNGMEDVAPQLR